MIREIGSEFHISLKTNSKCCKKMKFINKCYQDSVYTRSGREAIGFVLDEIKVNTKIALVPSYACKSMIEPFFRRGYSIEYFSIDRNFNPNLKDIEIALAKDPDIILIIDWFGMYKNKGVVSLVKRKCKDIIILEDRTHNFFDDSIQTDADFTIASLRKWIALPDGAIVMSHKSNFNNRIEFESNDFVDYRKKAMLLKMEYLNSGDKNLKLQFRKLFAEAESFIDNEESINGISTYSLSLINQVDFNSMRIKRRENFNVLYESINKSKIIPIANKIKTKDECPFCFPIIVENRRNGIQTWLAEKNVYCSVLWPLQEDAYAMSKHAAYISDNMLSIPCDQRYSTEDMEYIAELINEYLEEYIK